MLRVPPKGSEPAEPTTKLTAEVEDRVLEFLKFGSTFAQAAGAAGVTEGTFNGWLRRGARGEQPYKRFLEKIQAAAAFVQVQLAARVHTAGRKDWRANVALAQKIERGGWSALTDANRLIVAEVVAALREVLKPDEIDRCLEAIERRLRRSASPGIADPHGE